MRDPTSDPEVDIIDEIVENSIKRMQEDLHDVVLDSVHEACKEVVEDECGSVNSMWEDRMLDYKESMTDLVKEIIMKQFK